MGYDDEELNSIYDKSIGCCRYCGKRLSWKNYGVAGRRGAWEVDHGIPFSRGGSDYLRNLWAVCIDCNREKSDMKPWEYRSFLRRTYGWHV